MIHNIQFIKINNLHNLLNKWVIQRAVQRFPQRQLLM